MFFDDDFCLCGNADECKFKNNCKRAEKKVGIHTYSLFYHPGKNCEYFICNKEVNKNDKSKY